MISLVAGGSVRAWRRNHEVRFEELVEAMVEQDQARLERVEGTAPRLGPKADSANGDELTTSAPKRASNPRGRSHAAPLRPGSLDIDRASVPEWIRLPGIGPSLAARIVADRQARGPFGGPEGLLRVPGIGPKTLGKIRPFLGAGGRASSAPESTSHAKTRTKPAN
ncbi:MAG TPA: helix-hairpin-helix domain-containing protein [Candidatus Eisenbacteria bacterium]|nr:helix-hairpin-helix domain-containing protein [Candidatus Eisenbacteria bacterium]